MLNETPQQLIVKVTKQDIKEGVAESLHLCPIAKALRRIGFERISVDSDSIQIGRRKNVYELPWEATQFIEDFDNGINVKSIKFTAYPSTD